METYLTVGQVARIFSVTNYTVRVWLKDGKLQGHKPSGQWRIAKSEVARFANQLYGEKNATD